jgi:endonuclease-8
MEGPSLVILTEELKQFAGKVVKEVSGNAKIELQKLKNQKILAFLSWGKHFIIRFENDTLRIHFLMYGSYRINQSKDFPSRLTLVFENGVINFYSCSVKFIEGDIYSLYNWKIDIMSDQWDKKTVLKKVKEKQEEMICDVLMDQLIFAGVGNIIKNEVLFNRMLHPETLIKSLKTKELKAVVDEARAYSNNFYKWKKNFELRKHWKIFRKGICPRCDIKVIRRKTGRLQRISFYCNNCQIKPEI